MEEFLETLLRVDLAIHFFVTAAVVLIARRMGLNWWITFAVAIAFGIGKEMFDWFLKERFDTDDLVSDGIGMVLGIAVAALFGERRRTRRPRVEDGAKGVRRQLGNALGRVTGIVRRRPVINAKGQDGRAVAAPKPEPGNKLKVRGARDKSYIEHPKEQSERAAASPDAQIPDHALKVRLAGERRYRVLGKEESKEKGPGDSPRGLP